MEEKMKEAIVKAKAEGKQIAYRAIDVDEDYRVPSPGETLESSYEWVDGESTGYQLDGVAAFDATEEPEKAYKTAVEYFAVGHFEPERARILLIAGDDIGNGGMPEPMARLYRDAKVIAVFDGNGNVIKK
jgi:hypothetical protein